MFAKTDKKIVIISLVALVLILGPVFIIYKYVFLGKKDLNSNYNTTIQQRISQTPQENNPLKIEAPQVKLQNPAIQTQKKGSLMICADKCGDGICQKAGQVCPEGDNFNCACAETSSDCPQDCK